MSEQDRLVRRAPVRRLRRDERRRGRRPHLPHGATRSRACWSPGRCASARTPGSSARPSWSTRRASGIDAIIERHRGEPIAVGRRAPPPGRRRRSSPRPTGARRGGEPGIRPERFARLVTLASVLIAAGREERLPVEEVCEQLQISEQELREDVSVLNVVNFGGGAYVIYAEVLPVGRDRGRPRAVLGHVRPPRPAAADRGQRAGRGDRPDRRAPGPGRAGRRRATRSSPRSATTRSRRACTSPRRPRPTRSRATVEPAVHRRPPAGDRVLGAQRGRVLRTA